MSKIFNPTDIPQKHFPCPIIYLPMTRLFITGYPGFIARRLVRLLKESDAYDEIHALVEKRFLEVAKGLPESKGLILHPGDITEGNLGMEEPIKGITHAIHLAAIYDLATPREPAYRVNVEGTGNVMRFLEKQDSLRHITYISTAYVSGDRTGIVREDELDAGQGFKNYYEETKFLAEKVVVEEFSHLPVGIIRPGIVVGDSRTGETYKFDGPYFVMEALSRLPTWLPLPYVGKKDVKPNIVPVDYVVEGIFKVMTRELVNTYHLTDPDPMGLHEIYRLINYLLGRRHLLNFNISIRTFEFLLNFPPLRGSMPRQVLSYFETHALYDCTNARRDIGWNPPRFEEYAPVIMEYFLKNRGK